MKLHLGIFIGLLLIALAASIQINTQEQLDKLYFSKLTDPAQGYWRPMITEYEVGFNFNSKHYEIDRFPLQSTFFKLAGYQFEIKHYELNEWLAFKGGCKQH